MSRIGKRKVFVGLSGGVDSSVSAALLSARGGSASGGKKIRYDVTGVFIRVWHEDADKRGLERGFTLMKDTNCCQAAEDRLDAMRVCAKLGIPFVELNLEKEYKKEVVDYMIREYRAGRTPNPDVFCNRFIKFGAFYKFARKNGADFVATGHYARIRSVKDKGLRIKDFGLLAGSDPQKDQSYFLWQLRREQLPHILFPVGGMKKPEVRRLAKKFGLITADKKDSQGLCFVGKVDMKEFLSHYIKPRKGEVLLAADARGFGRRLARMKEIVIGEHNGVMFYTIGERLPLNADLTRTKRGLHAERGRPYYVVGKDAIKNTLTVSPKGLSGELLRARTDITVGHCNWISLTPVMGKSYRARVRYRQPLQPCTLINADMTRMNADRRGLHQRISASESATIRVRFESAQNAAPGQSLVLYDENICLGGGILS